MKFLCIGNRFLNPDGAAIWLMEAAQEVSEQWLPTTQWVEGGLGGLNLLPHFETTDPVVIVDYAPDYPHASLIPWSQLQLALPTHYDHNTALYYGLHTLNQLLDPPPPLALFSLNPKTTTDWQAQALDRLAQLQSQPERLH